MNKNLIYNFSGELDDISHLFPNERLAQIAAIISHENENVEIWDRGNVDELLIWGKKGIEELSRFSFYESSNPYLKHVEKEVDSILSKGITSLYLNLWQGSGFKFSIDLARMLKTINPKVKIYGIGQKVDWYRENILKLAPFLDGIILGLEYSSIHSMLKGTEIKRIPNMILNIENNFIFTKRQIVDINNYSEPHYSSEIYKGIQGKIPLYSISLSNQACRGRCAFCVRPVNYGRTIIKRNISKVINELEHLIHGQKAQCFRINDSTPPAYTLTELAKKIIETGLDQEEIVISAFSRIDLNQNENFELLKKAKIGALFFGIESLDDNNLEKMKKGINFKMIKNTLKKAHQAGLFTIGSFIFPLPGETKKTMAITLERIAVLKDHLDSVLTRPSGVYPVSDWGKNPQKYGIKLSSDYLEETIIYPIKQLLPLKYLPPFPYSYDMMGKKADKVNFQDITEYYDQFTNIIRNEINIPGIPDYYWSLANHLEKDVIDFTKKAIEYMIQRDYKKFKDMIQDMKKSG